MTTPLWTITPATHPQVIDLSHNNAKFTTLAEFEALKTAGITDVIHKATQGVSFVDPSYQSRMQFTLQAGLRWSAYHFCTNDPIEKQQEFFILNACPFDGLRWYALDAEMNRGTTIDPTQAAAFAVSLDKLIASQMSALGPTERQCLRYGNASVLEYKQSGWHDGPMWWAKYGPEPTVEQMSALGIDPTRVVLWQASAAGHIVGNGPLDLSYLRPVS